MWLMMDVISNSIGNPIGNSNALAGPIRAIGNSIGNIIKLIKLIGYVYMHAELNACLRKLLGACMRN